MKDFNNIINGLNDEESFNLIISLLKNNRKLLYEVTDNEISKLYNKLIELLSCVKDSMYIDKCEIIQYYPYYCINKNPIIAYTLKDNYIAYILSRYIRSSILTIEKDKFQDLIDSICNISNINLIYVCDYDQYKNLSPINKVYKIIKKIDNINTYDEKLFNKIKEITSELSNSKIQIKRSFLSRPFGL